LGKHSIVRLLRKRRKHEEEFVATLPSSTRTLVNGIMTVGAATMTLVRSGKWGFPEQFTTVHEALRRTKNQTPSDVCTPTTPPRPGPPKGETTHEKQPFRQNPVDSPTERQAQDRDGSRALPTQPHRRPSTMIPPARRRRRILPPESADPHAVDPRQAAPATAAARAGNGRGRGSGSAPDRRVLLAVRRSAGGRGGGVRSAAAGQRPVAQDPSPTAGRQQQQQQQDPCRRRDSRSPAGATQRRPLQPRPLRREMAIRKDRPTSRPPRSATLIVMPLRRRRPPIAGWRQRVVGATSDA
jgi:hypothetical protein